MQLSEKKGNKNPSGKRGLLNNKLYIWMIVIAITITLIPSFFMNGDSKWFTIITSITCGGIASTVVAWLIDIANCKYNERRKHDHQEAILKGLYLTFENDIQILILESMKYLQDETPKRWYEWMESAYKIIKDHPDFENTYIKVMKQFFSELVEQIHIIQIQEAFLLDTNIITNNDIALFRIMQNLVRSILIEQETKHITAKDIKTEASILKTIIGSSDTFKRINYNLIEPFLYKKLSENEAGKEQGEENQ